MKWLIISVLLVVSATPGFSGEYKVSMLPRYFPETLTAMLSPLADYLSKQTGEKIEYILTKNFADYEARVKSGEIAIAYQNPVVYINVSSVQEVLAMALKGKDGDQFRGIIITRPDSNINTLADLQGKQVMIVSKTSAGGYLSQLLSLNQNGIDVSSISFEEAADNRQENVIISVSVGEVDAGFIRESALHKADKYILPGSIKSVSNTAWLPNWAFSVNRSLPEGLRESVRKAILNIQSDGKIISALNLKGFTAATDSDYDTIRQLVIHKK
jgi:phosphonate transport system substrate-binding protein